MNRLTIYYVTFFLVIVVGWSAGLAQSILMRDHDVVRTTDLTSDNDTLKTAAKSPTGAMIRSLLIPGWGQIYNKKYIKAVVIFGAEVGLLVNSIYLNQKYKASQTLAEREFYINNRNLSNWWLVGTILFSMADAFVDAHLANFDEGPDLSSLKLIPVGDKIDRTIGISVLINF